VRARYALREDDPVLLGMLSVLRQLWSMQDGQHGAACTAWLLCGSSGGIARGFTTSPAGNGRFKKRGVGQLFNRRNSA
jgi:hypothetical protein